MHGGAVGVLMLHDGKLHGGDSFFYFIGTYSCSDGKLKGEMTHQEHTKAPIWRPMKWTPDLGPWIAEVKV